MGVMTNAVRHVHGQNGPWNTDGGYELPAIILAALADDGPGKYSLDGPLGIRLRGPAVTLLAMGAGAASARYVAAHGEELFGRRDVDEPLSRAVEHVGAES